MLHFFFLLVLSWNSLLHLTWTCSSWQLIWNGFFPENTLFTKIAHPVEFRQRILVSSGWLLICKLASSLVAKLSNCSLFLLNELLGTVVSKQGPVSLGSTHPSKAKLTRAAKTMFLPGNEISWTKRYLRAANKLEASAEKIIERACALSKGNESNKSIRVRDWEVTWSTLQVQGMRVGKFGHWTA